MQIISYVKEHIMNTLHICRSVTVAAFVCGSIMLVPAVDAATVVYDIDFTELTDDPEDWTPLVNEAGWDVVDSLGYRYLRGSGAGASAPGLTSYTGDILGGDPASGLDNYMVESYLSKSTTSGNWAGVAARLQDASNYYLAVLTDAATLRIYRVQNGTETSIASDSPIDENYSVNSIWRISLSVAGNQLEAKVYNSNDELVGSTNTVDNTFSSGTFGLRGHVSNNHNAAFRSLTVTTVDFEEPEPILVANPSSGYIFDLGEFEQGESVVLPGMITLSNDGTGIIQRTGFNMTGSGLFDIQGLIREGTTITPEDPHIYDIAFFGSVTPGVYEATATFVTTEGEISYTLRATVVPEPAALSLLAAAGVGLVGRRVRRRGDC